MTSEIGEHRYQRQKIICWVIKLNEEENRILARSTMGAKFVNGRKFYSKEIKDNNKSLLKSKGLDEQKLRHIWNPILSKKEHML